LIALDAYCDLFAKWCRELSRTRDPDELQVRLFAFEGPALGERHSEQAAGALNGSAALFNRIVTVGEARQLSDVFYSLSAERRPRDRTGLGIFVDQLFRGCRLRGQEFSSWRP
jgi:hypothetical protein